MVLPLLLSFGLPALAGSTALAGTALGGILGGLSAPALAGIGAGLGSFIQTGDLGDGIKTGLTSFLGGKLLGGLTGSSSPAALAAGQGTGGAVTTGTTEAAKPGFLSSVFGPSPSITDAMSTATAPGFLNTVAPNAGAGLTSLATAATLPGVMPAAFIGNTMASASMAQRQAQEASARAEAEREASKPPMPRPMRVTQNSMPFAGGGGEGLYFQYARPPAPAGYTPQYPYSYADGGLLGLRRMQEGGEMEAGIEVEDRMSANGMNEKDVIVQAISAIRGESAQPEIILGMFVQKYGEDALRDLVERVQSGEFDDTVERFESGEKGMVRGPGDGSGVDDMVPATLEGEQDVLLSDGEFVLRKKTADALEKAYGGGFLDIVNRAEDAAPNKLEAMVG